MEAVRQVVRHFMFREYLIFPIPFPEWIWEFPQLASMTMMKHHQLYSPSSELELVRKFGVVWTETLKIKARAPEVFFKSSSEMDKDFKVRVLSPTIMYQQRSKQ